MFFRFNRIRLSSKNYFIRYTFLEFIIISNKLTSESYSAHLKAFNYAAINSKRRSLEYLLEIMIIPPHISYTHIMRGIICIFPTLALPICLELLEIRRTAVGDKSYLHSSILCRALRCLCFGKDRVFNVLNLRKEVVFQSTRIFFATPLVCSGKRLFVLHFVKYI